MKKNNDIHPGLEFHEGSTDTSHTKVNLEALPILATRNIVLFPGVTFPINVVREESKKLVEEAERRHMAIGVVSQLDPSVDSPGLKDLYEYGVVATVQKVLPLPDDTLVAVVSAMHKFRTLGACEADSKWSITVKARQINETRARRTAQFDATMELCAARYKLLSKEAPGNDGPMLVSIENLIDEDDPTMSVNMMCTFSPIEMRFKRELLAERTIRARADGLLAALMAKQENDRLNSELEERARRKLGGRQRNVFLEQQLEEIRNELYGDDCDDATRLRKRCDEANLSADTRRAVIREIGKIEKLNPQSPDYQTQVSYVQTVLDLPWGTYTTDSSDFQKAEETLNANHSGLEKVKERVLEQLALIMHSPNGHAPILCLVGPPGVGKTSLGQSIADAVGRKFQRLSLGGLHDESEIRGHRRTYIGAMPGRIVEAMRRAGSMNPVLMLDEIDKVGHDYKGDPAAALLEVLDPEQNSKFHDNYIDLDFDLSKVMFITTANTLDTISRPLLDRMEIIRLSGYSPEEKMSIARQHLIPSLLTQYELPADKFDITDEALGAIIDNYTAESGVRLLKAHLSTILRKRIHAIVSGREFPNPVGPADLQGLLGTAPISRDRYGTDNQPGVVTGLAWTAAGGEILFIEAVLIDSKGDSRLSLTGNLGDVMKESATLAHRYVQAHHTELGISAKALQGHNVHIHVPEGAIPKDGPSAGITMTTAIVSAYTGRPVRQHVAMTGEMTLRGKVLPVGGIKEKILAAKRAGVKEIILCEENRRNVEEIKADYVEGLTFHYVTGVDEVLRISLAE
jgi:ATP-dependent Lon protease